MIVNRKNNGVLGTSFLNRNPEWADLAYEALFKRDTKSLGEGGHYGLQHAVAEAMKVAYEMGRAGRKPPWPANRDPRRHEPPPPDPDTEQIANEMRFLAWSPLAGTDQPDGHMKWKLSRIFAEREEAQSTHTRTVRRSKPEPPPITKLVRRSR